MRQPDLSLIIACYNEEQILEDGIKAIESILKNTKLSYEVILVDDRSKDKTADIIKKVVAKNKKYYSAIFHEENQGRGKAVTNGIKEAKGRVVGFIDIDLEVSPVYIPFFVTKILDGVDIVSGHRIYRESLFSLHRAILSRGYSLLVRKTLNIPLNDTESGYKFFNREKIIQILKDVKDSHWFWDTEVMALSYYRKLKIKEIPVLFVRRFDKKSSVKIFEDVKDYLVNLYKFRKRLKSLKYL